ncbi:Mechanosensory protein 2 [Taenia solium]|eukprot:TsM_000058100 transcript=TsM_000058100 gene=TsM_000058100
MINTNTGTTSPNNDSGTGQRNGEPRNHRDQTDAFQMRQTTARLLRQSPDPGSIGEEEEEDTSLQSESRLVQANQRFVPSAPPRTHIPGTPESAHSKSKSRRNQPYESPGKKPTPSRRYGKQQPSPPQKDYPSREPRSPPQPLSSSSKMPTFENDAEGFMGELEVSHDQNEKTDWFTSLLTVLSMIMVVMTFPFSMIFCLKIVAEYERAVVLRMGRLLPGGQGTRGPGLFFVLPCIDSVRTVELRTVTFSIPPQEVLTRDSVTVAVDAVVYYRICNPAVSILNVEDAARSTRLLAQTTLRNVLGTKDLAQILMDREEMSVTMQATIDAATEAWGVERVEIKDVRLPVALQRAMAAEAEATREARAKVIAANGEHKASSALKEAANVIASSPLALQLRYLQTLCAISAEKNSTIIFPLPIDILHSSAAAVSAKLCSSTISLDDGDPQSRRRKAMVRQWLPSLSPDHPATPNPRALLPGMGEPDPLIPQPVPPQLPESQRRRYEAAALLTVAGTTKKANATAAATTASPIPPVASATTTARDSQPPPPLPCSQLGISHEDFDDTCSDSV